MYTIVSDYNVQKKIFEILFNMKIWMVTLYLI